MRERAGLMDVTLTVSTPDHPEPHVVTYRNCTSVRYTADSSMIDTVPGWQFRFADRVERWDDRAVLDVLSR
jgi:hypothetical protein